MPHDDAHQHGAREPYMKAAGSDRFAPLYDITVRLVMRERHIRQRVLECAELAPGQTLLDVGCGTGTLALMARQRHPQAKVFGVDGDPTILRIARRKTRRKGADVQFDEAMAYAMPYAASSFDAVVSTLTLHHLTPDQQERTLSEIRRVLRPGGRLVVADFAPPHNRLMALSRGILKGLMRFHQHAHGHAQGAPHVGPIGFELRLSEKGWTRIAPPEFFMTLVGTLGLYSAVRPFDA